MSAIDARKSNRKATRRATRNAQPKRTSGVTNQATRDAKADAEVEHHDTIPAPTWLGEPEESLEPPARALS